MNPSECLKGIGVSPGIAIGEACVMDDHRSRLPLYHLTSEQVDNEIERLKAAIAAAKAELESIRKLAAPRLGESHLYILDVGILLLGDDMLIGEAQKQIQSNRTNAEWAIQAAIDHFTRIFEGIDDPYLRDRSLDIAHAGERILRHLAIEEGREDENASTEPAIIVARDLTPADVAALSADRMMGLVTELGGQTSHTAILAKALGIPAVVGAESATRRISTGDRIILDAHAGAIILDPSPEELAKYHAALHDQPSFAPSADPEAVGPVSTRDGTRIHICVNIEYDRELDLLPAMDLDGVGLYRSEHLYFNRAVMPDEEEHFAHYRRLAEFAYPDTAVVRTMDMGGDRPPPAFAKLVLEEPNPALGLRATRFSLRHKELFKLQLRGILRASVHGNLKIMYPMISGLDEVITVRGVLNEAKAELREEGQLFAEPEEGVLIETPAAAVCADLLAREMDFISVGSNDLTQYTLAVDRTNKEVVDLFEPFHPAMLRIYRNLVQTAASAGKPITVCGELASEPESALILIGLGFRSLSMTMSRIPEVKRAIRGKTIAELEKFAFTLLDCETGSGVRALLKSNQSGLRRNSAPLRSSA